MPEVSQNTISNFILLQSNICKKFILNRFKKIYKFLYNNNLIFIIYLLCLCLFIWGIPGKGVLYFGDVQASYIFSPQKVYGTVYIWQDLFNSGALNFGIFQNYLFSFLVVLSSFLFNLSWHSYLHSFLGYFLFALSAFYLYKRLFNNRFVGFIIALFFLTSPITYTYNSCVLLLYSLAFINFALLYFSKIFRLAHIKTIQWKECITIGLLLTLANVYIQNFFLIIYIFPFFLLIYFKKFWRNKVYFLKNFSAFGLIYLLLNHLWIFILVHQLLYDKNNFIQAAVQTTSGIDVANLITKLTNIANFFRILPYHFTSGGDPIAHYNTNPVLLVLSYLVSIFALSAVFFNKNKKYKRGILFSLLVFIALFPILNGNKEPFKEFFMFAWNYIPFFQLFRTFTKFMFIILYAVSFLLAVSILSLQNRSRIRCYINILLVIIFTAPILIYNSKILQERFFTQDTIPNYYYNLKNSFNEPLETKTIIMPQTNWLVTYKWRPEQKDTDNIAPLFYNGRILTNGAAYEHTQEWQNYNNIAASFVVNKYFEKLGYLFSFKNVNFVLLQDDISPFLDFNKGTRITVESNLKGGTAFFKKVVQFGDLYVFEIPEKFFNQQIFSPREIILIDRENPHLDLIKQSPLIISGILSEKVKNTDSVFIFEEQNTADLDYPILKKSKLLFNYTDALLLDYASPEDSPKIAAVTEGGNFTYGKNISEIMNLKNLDLNPTQIEFKKQSPVQYEIYIHNAAPKNIPLLFNNTYDSGWDIYPSTIQTKKNIEFNNYKSKNQFIKQADQKDIMNYLRNNKISVLGDHFISKEYNRSIQNNNLKSTPFWKILFTKKIEKQKQIYANGYSKMFILDPEEICAQRPNSCKKNNNETYDVRLTLYFTPQKYFYFTSSLSVIVLITCLVYLTIYVLNKKRV